MNKKNISLLQFYNKEAINYAEKSAVVFVKLLNSFISKLKVKEVLDIGCGPGHDTDYFFKNGIKATGVDMSPKMINLAKKKYDKKIDFKVANVLNQNFFNSYSIKNIWISAMLMHLKEKDRVNLLKKLNYLMKEDGILGIIIPKKKEQDIRKARWNKMGKIFDTFSRKEVFDLIKKSNFKIIEIKKFYFHKHPWWFILSKKTKNIL